MKKADLLAQHPDATDTPDRWCPRKNAYLITPPGIPAPILVTHPEADEIEMLGIIDMESVRREFDQALLRAQGVGPDSK